MTILPIIENPERSHWAAMLARPVLNMEGLDLTVRKILEDVKKNGDQAVAEYSLTFDKVSVTDRAVQDREFDEAEKILAPELKMAIRQARQNIEKFHANQLISEPIIETMPGIRCWRKSVAIEKVGLYIPGGTAALFSTLLMLAVPAKLAGCKEVVICTPPQLNGKIHPAILFTAKMMGLQKIFRVSGVQAIAAMAYGTETIPAVYKIFGPGNQYVTHAKKLIQLEGIAIDMPAGPSELAVYADEKAIPAFIAADLLSQCEHGPDSHVILVATRRDIAEKVNRELQIQIEKLPRKSVAEKSLGNSKIFLMTDPVAAMDLINFYAPEHLILACRDTEMMSARVGNAGSVFIGNYAPESAGDYASGPNHTLPTNGTARAYSGVSTDSFMKKISFQEISPEGLESIGETVIEMAKAEGLAGHAEAVKIRLRPDLTVDY
jgi:histidinol dehydrogenase